MLGGRACVEDALGAPYRCTFLKKADTALNKHANKYQYSSDSWVCVSFVWRLLTPASAQRQKRGFEAPRALPLMAMESEDANDQVFENNVKKLRDVRRYDKRTLVCPSGCGAELALFQIPRHDCVKDLKSKLKMMEEKLQSKEQSGHGTQEEIRGVKLEQLQTERTSEGETQHTNEALYQEQLNELRDQVARLQRALRERERVANGVDAITEEVEEEGGDWKARYERLLAGKVDLEKVFRERERGYQQQISALRAETAMLQQDLHLERKMLSLEDDRAACEKLEGLTDQLEQLIKRKQQHEQKTTGKYADASTKNGRIRHRIPHNSVGSSWSSDISELDEEEAVQA